MAVTLSGGCHCRSTTYAITIPDEPVDLIPGFKAPLCDFDHCTTCRKTSGALFQAWLMVPRDWVDIHSASPSSKASEGSISDSPLTSYRSSPNILRSFCSKCGTHLFYYNDSRKGTPGDKISVTLGSLDEKSLANKDMVRPRLHSWWGEGVGWVKDMIRGVGGIGELPRHPGGDPRVVVDE